MNSWPGGHRRAMSQSEHARWNAQNYPGTRQICVKCDEPTGNAEDHSNYTEDNGPYCGKCYEEEVNHE